MKKNIFFCSFSLSHNKLSHFFSSFFFFLLAPSLSPSLTSSLLTDFSLYLPLFSFFSLFLLPCITLFFNKVFFFLKIYLYIYILITLGGFTQYTYYTCFKLYKKCYKNYGYQTLENILKPIFKIITKHQNMR